MCGIFGFYLNRPLVEKDIINAKIALKLQNHRGPDNTGYWCSKEEGIFLGHNRLSIIDLNKYANQPMSEDNSVITYNGEIYNFKDIKRKYFNDSTKFFSRSDTEVLLKLWNLKGSKCLNELDGMFAFGIYVKEEVNLVVDHFGEKPLYYLNNEEGVYFASEISPLLRMCNCNLRKDKNFVDEFLLFGYINSPYTAYEGINKVPPSTIINIKKIGASFLVKKELYWIKPERYYQNTTNISIPKEKIKDLKNLIVESVESRLVSDVPIGLFLSSGIDSTLLASIVRLELNKKIKCFTVKFDKNLIHDESESSEKIAEYLNLEHEILINKKEENYTIANLLNLYSNDLNDNTTIFSYYEMSKLASKKVKVALSGLGGDELFLGYNRYIFFSKYLRKIYFLRKLKNKLIKSNEILNGPLNKLSRLYNNFLTVPESDFYLRYKNLDQNELFNNNSKNLITKYFNNSDKYFFDQMFKYDINQTMPCSYIPANDLGGMKASLEIRSPFLNKKIYEYLANNFNQRDILNYGSKQILKDILSNYIPIKLISKKKQGFVFPIDEIIQKNNKSNLIGKRVLLRKKILDASSSVK